MSPHVTIVVRTSLICRISGLRALRRQNLHRSTRGRPPVGGGLFFLGDLLIECRVAGCFGTFHPSVGSFQILAMFRCITQRE